MRKPPAYRIRTLGGRRRAVVTLTDSLTGRRRDYYLGEPNTPESWAEYARLLTEWQTFDHRLPDVPQSSPTRPTGPTVAQIAGEYKRDNFKDVVGDMAENTIALLSQMYGKIPATQFGPNALRQLRETMIAGNPTSGRKKWRRSVVLRQTALVVKIFKWAVAHERIEETVWRRLTSLEQLDPKREDVEPNQKIRPAPIMDVRKVQAAAGRQIAAIIELQLLTGARVEEILNLRPGDIDRFGEVWKAELDKHKTAHRGRRRVLYFGPKAQKVLAPFLLRPSGVHLFSPAEAEEERLRKRQDKRKTPPGYGNTRGSNRVECPRKKPQDHYTKDSYCRYIVRICKKLGIPVWTPRQLRHNAATEFEKQYDSVTASILLGHSSAKITEAVYIEREDKAAVNAIAEIG